MEEEEKVISASNETLLWEKLTADFIADPDPVEYHAVLEQDERRVLLDIFNNHAVGFEAVAYTSFNSYLYSRSNFRFSIHHQGFTDEIAKLFGMQDIVLGFKDFDEKFIIKTNDESKITTMLAGPELRNTLMSIPSLTFEIVEYTLENADGKAPFLELKAGKSITDPIQLRKIYHAFLECLKTIES
jgi:hypothetical protein